MLAPEGEDVGFNGTTRRAIVVKASNATVDLERGDVKETAFECVNHSLPKSFSVLGFLGRVHFFRQTPRTSLRIQIDLSTKNIHNCWIFVLIKKEKYQR